MVSLRAILRFRIISLTICMISLCRYRFFVFGFIWPLYAFSNLTLRICFSDSYVTVGLSSLKATLFLCGSENSLRCCRSLKFTKMINPLCVHSLRSKWMQQFSAQSVLLQPLCMVSLSLDLCLLSLPCSHIPSLSCQQVP